MPTLLLKPDSWAKDILFYAVSGPSYITPRLAMAHLKCNTSSYKDG